MQRPAPQPGHRIQGTGMQIVAGTSRQPPPDAQLLCGYSQHLCGREKLAGHDFCLRHILDDRSAPFKQCNYTYRPVTTSTISTGFGGSTTLPAAAAVARRCPRPAPKSDRKDGYCVEHSKRSLIARQKSSARKRSAGSSVATLAKALEDLDHYKKVKGLAPAPVTSSGDGEEKKQENDEVIDNMVRLIPSVHQRVFDNSELDSDEEPQTLEATWNGGDHEDHSDAESVDSELDNPLKHAEKYSAEEVVRIMRDKLIRLQKLYIDQFQKLRFLLKEEGRKYKHDLLAEKEQELSSIHNQKKQTLEDIANYGKIKSLNHYQRPQGLEAELHYNFQERRLKLSESSNSQGTQAAAAGSSHGQVKVTVLPKCQYHITSSMKCGDAVIPLAKYCIKHILEDQTQVLFRPCGFVVNLAPEDQFAGGSGSKDGPCETPIADVLEGATCVYHTQFQNPFTTQDPEKPGSSEPPRTEEENKEEIKEEPKEEPKEEAEEEPKEETNEGPKDELADEVREEQENLIEQSAVELPPCEAPNTVSPEQSKHPDPEPNNSEAIE